MKWNDHMKGVRDRRRAGLREGNCRRPGSRNPPQADRWPRAVLPLRRGRRGRRGIMMTGRTTMPPRPRGLVPGRTGPAGRRAPGGTARRGLRRRSRPGALPDLARRAHQGTCRPREGPGEYWLHQADGHRVDRAVSVCGALLGFSAAFCGILAVGLAVAALVAFASTTILVFLVGNTAGRARRWCSVVRYLRQEVAANISPRLQHIEFLLRTLQAELHLDIATRIAEKKISGRFPGDPPTGW